MATIDHQLMASQMADRGYAFHKLDGDDPLQF